MEPIRILIADDHKRFGEGLRARLDPPPKTSVSGAANSFSKLQVADRTAAIIQARGAGLGWRGWGVLVYTLL